MDSEQSPALAASARCGLIADHARRDPDALALLAPGRPALTFGALLREVERIGLSLAAAGLGRGNRVAVALPNGPELAMAVLAVSDCTTCVPVNPALDEAACALLLKTCRVDALLIPDRSDSTAEQIARALGLLTFRVVSRDDEPAGTMQLVTDARLNPRLPEPVQPDDLALLMHTSGTTSRPKSVPISHRKLSASIVNQVDAMQLTSVDRCLCVTALFTNSGIRRSLLGPLVVGGSTVCTPGFQARAFVDWLEEFAPTYYAAGPAVHLELIAEFARRSRPVRHTLRFVWSGFTPLSADVEERLERALGVPIIQAYGMCEAGQVASNRLPPGRRRRESVGLPIAIEVAIRDGARQPVPPRGVGDIWVRGPSVITAYENDSEANEQAFHDGWFKTGDLGHLDEEGYLFLTGRVKEQINRGGVKVSPSEVDAALMRHPEVVDAATFAVAHATLGEDVAAAVVVREGAAVTAQQLRDFAFGELATFKVPSRIVLVPVLPKSAQGKMRRRELAEALARYLRPEPVATSGAHEELTARYFADVLGVAPIGAQDNFFDLGGDSLRGAQLVTRVNAALGLDLDPGTLFWRPTVAEFALELERAVSGKGGAVVPPVMRRPRDGRVVKKEPSR
ncbi:MAG: AMP-dependent synthetase [Betaproteobacteria bacterium]|nr:MAG: AMP-dependent synthetase [Betaproteobacteria bacterium]